MSPSGVKTYRKIEIDNTAYRVRMEPAIKSLMLSKLSYRCCKLLSDRVHNSRQHFQLHYPRVTGRFGPESLRPWVVSAKSFRPIFMGRFGLIFSNPRLITLGKINIYVGT